MIITPDLAAALFHLRQSALTGALSDNDARALNTLDNSGIFSAIDEETEYDVSSPVTVPDGRDPAEWGDLAFRTL